MATLADKIEAKQRKIQQEQAALQMLKNKKAQQARKDDTRKKILIGAAVLKRMETDEKLSGFVNGLLEKELTRGSDRALFGLDPLPPAAAAGAGTPARCRHPR